MSHRFARPTAVVSGGFMPYRPSAHQLLPIGPKAMCVLAAFFIAAFFVVAFFIGAWVSNPIRR